MLLLLIVSHYKSRICVFEHISGRKKKCAYSVTDSLLAAIIATVGSTASHEGSTLGELVLASICEVMVTESHRLCDCAEDHFNTDDQVQYDISCIA